VPGPGRLNWSAAPTDDPSVKALKLALLLELELGCVWTLPLLAARPEDAGLAALLMFLPIYGVHLICMVIGAVLFRRRPESRGLAAAVLTVPIGLLFLPAMIRVVAGGPVTPPAAAWLLVPGLPLGACLLVPQHVAEFIPRWTLRSRWLNVGTVVLLSMLLVCWAVVLAAGLASASGAGHSGVRGEDLRDALLDGTGGAVLLAVVGLAALSTLLASITFLTSYLGLFQRVDRTHHRLRIAQLVLSIVVLAPSALILAAGLLVAGVALTPLG
jgi:hypothetical protein